MSEWKLVTLGDTFDLRMGKTPDRSNPLFWNNGENKWISIADISSASKFIVNTKETISDASIAKTGIKKVPKGTVLMSFKLSVGKVCITSEDVYTNEAIMAFLPKPNKDVDVDFLYYRLLVNKWTEGLNKAVKGITLNKASLNNTKLYFPKIDLQRKIADILDKASELIILQKKQLEILDILAETEFYIFFGNPVKNEKGWEVSKIQNLVEGSKNALKAGPFGSSLKKEFYTETGYKIYGQEQVIANDAFYGDYFISEKKYKELESCAVKSHDVLISLVGSYGRTLIIPTDFLPGIINPRLMKISFNREKMNPVFFRFLFATNAIQSHLATITHGGTMPILNLGIVKDLNVILPPLALQNKFAEVLTKIEEQKSNVRQALQDSENLFQRLVQDLFKEGHLN